MGTKKNYDHTFREGAVKLQQSRDNNTELATELGVFAGYIYKWRAEFIDHGKASFQGHSIGLFSDEDK